MIPQLYHVTGIASGTMRPTWVEKPPEQYNMNMICKAQMEAINKVLMVRLALYC